MMSIKSPFRACLILLACLFLPTMAAAQTNVSGGIAGVARDTSGAVLPGVTVEAASDALIEKVRSVVTDEAGNYKILELRPGTYTVTFTLPGFSTVRREGVELNAGFTATINADMKVGALEETVVVTGASPVVDTQNVRSQTLLTRETLDTLPTGQTVQSWANMILGTSIAFGAGGGADTGGLAGDTNTTVGVHGSRPGQQKLLVDGMSYVGQINNGGGGGQKMRVNQAMTQEVVLEARGTSAETESPGVQYNVVPKDGGNNIRGTSFANYAGEDMAADNLGDLRARGLQTAVSAKQIYDMGFGVGGPLKQDRLWYYAGARKWKAEQYAPGNYYNSTQHTLFYTPDLSRPAYSSNFAKDGALRLTWQAAEKHKLTWYEGVQSSCTCHGRITELWSTEATANSTYWPQVLSQTTWTYPATSRLLFQAGFTHLNSPRHTPRHDGVVPTDIPVTEQSTGFRYNARAGSPTSLGATDYSNGSDDQVNGRFSMSYVTGSHAFKVGYMGLQGTYEIYTEAQDPPVAYTLRNRVPVSVTYYASPQFAMETGRSTAIYAQDQWTLRNMTLNLGLRYDQIVQWVPDQVRPGGIYAPELRISRIDNVPNWKDISPRLGVAYDLFSNGKTALKASVGRYVFQEGTQVAQSVNPSRAMVTAATRNWNDANGNYTPEPNELGPLSNANFGTVRIATTWDPDLLEGWGKREYSWQATGGIQHELRPGVGVAATYYRTWFGNFRVTENTAVSPSDYTSFCLTGPADPRLPGGGNQRICGLYDINPTAFGRVSNLVTSASRFGTQTEIYNGGEVTINARFGRGGLLAGGFSTGQTVTNTCSRLAIPNVTPRPSSELDCEVTNPFSANTQVKFNGNYPLPLGLQASVVFQSVAGAPINGNFVFTNAQVAPSLGRNLGSCRGAATCAGTYAVANIYAPNTLFEQGRLNQFDIRFTKNFPMGRRRLRGSFDIYNLTNDNQVMTSNARFGSAWQTPTNFVPGRLFKVGGQFDF